MNNRKPLPAPTGLRVRPELVPLEPRDVPATLRVNSLFDDVATTSNVTDTTLTLREAINVLNTANGTTGGPVSPPNPAAPTTGYGTNDQILFTTGLAGTITLSSALPPVNKNVLIQGNGTANLTIDGGNLFRIFDVAAGLDPGVSFADMRLFQGKAPTGGGGGGAIRAASPISVNSVVFDANQADSGGAVSINTTNSTPSQILSSVFTNNKALTGNGGAVEATEAAVNIQRSIFRTNTAQISGGAVFHTRVPSTTAGGITISDSEFSAGNEALTADGGAINVINPKTTDLFENLTVVGNKALASEGGGIDVDAGAPSSNGTLRIVNSTVTGNQAAQGGGVNTANGAVPFVLFNSVVVGNTATTQFGDVASGSSLGGNVIGDASAGFLGRVQPSDLTGVTLAAAKLGPLANNGGPVSITPILTVGLLAGSPALDRGLQTSTVGVGLPAVNVTATQPGNDGRNFSRPTTGPVDAGAFQARFPSAAPDNYTTPFNTTLTVPAATGLIASNDTAGEPTVAPLTATNVSALSNPAAGTLTVNPDGSLTFAPTSGFTGAVTFTYTATDVRSTAPVTATITVAAPNAIVPAPDTYTTPFNAPLTVPAPGLLANDTGGSGPLTAASAAPPLGTQGTVVVNADGSFTFTPVAGFSGPASFTYTATDGFTTSSPTIVNVVVGAPAAIVTLPDAYTTPAGTPLVVPAPGVLANDTGGTGTLRATVVTPPTAAQGTLLFTAAGAFTFTPATGFAGAVTFTYTATDGVSTSGPQTVTITVTPSAATPAVFAAATGAGVPSQVTVYQDDGNGTFTAAYTVAPFEATFLGGARVAMGDVTGDGTPDLVVAAGTGGGPRLSIFDGRTRQVVANRFLYEPTFTGGLFVSVADVTGDGTSDIVIGAGSLGGPRVTVLAGNSFAQLADTFVYDPTFRGGVRVATSQLNAATPGFEIVTGAGVSGAPHIRGFSLAALQAAPAGGAATPDQGNFFAGDTNSRAGVFLAGVRDRVVTGQDSLADFSGSILELLYPGLTDTGGSVNNQNANNVQLQQQSTVSVYDKAGNLSDSTVAFPGFLGGVRVGAASTGSRAFVIAAPGAGGGGRVRVYPLSATNTLGTPQDVVPFGGDTSVYVGGAIIP